MEAQQRGEAFLDRARAAEAENDLATARAKLNDASATISGDPFYWYFSASLAMRERDAVTARASIEKALKLAPSDPAILFEAGHVADFTGDDDSARSYWTRAAAGDPNGPVGKAAAKAVEMLGVDADRENRARHRQRRANRVRNPPRSRPGPSGRANCRRSQLQPSHSSPSRGPTEK